MKTLARPDDKAEIKSRLNLLRPDSAPRWGRMAVSQMVCHLTDSLRMAMRQKRVTAATGPLQRTVLKWVALYLPVRWLQGIRTRPEIDQALGGTRPVAFAADVAELLGLMELFTATPSALDGHAHPVFGPMSAADWYRWGYLHMDQHLRQFGA